MPMRNNVFLVAGLVFLFMCGQDGRMGGKSPSSEKKKIEWLSWNEMIKVKKKSKKKIFIDVYTTWCGWCRYMDANVFTHPDVVETINKYYIPVKLDAEMKDTIYFDNHVFVNPAPGIPRSTHQLAYALLDGRTAYPSFVILDSQLRRLQILQGAMAPEKLIDILLYFGTDSFQKMTFDEFLKNRKGGNR